MGQTITIHCDLCGSTDQVQPLVVSRPSSKTPAWEVDTCEKCYQDRFAELEAHKRKPSTSSLRPPARAKRTDSSEYRL
mgnify:CR=1 FL=1